MAPSPAVETLTSVSALAWTPIVIAAIVVAGRVFVRVRRQAFGTDDYLMVLSLLFAIVSAGLAEAYYQADPHDDLLELGHLNTIAVLAPVTGILSLTLGKSSVACLLLLLIGPTGRFKRWFLISSMAILSFLAFILIIATMIPTCDLVLPSIEYGVACIDNKLAEGYVQSWNFYGVFIDLAYSTLPVAILYTVQMSASKKATILVLLGLGWIAGIFTLLRALTAFNLWDPATASFIVRLATAMEQGLVIVCGSLATLTPLYHYFFHKIPISPYRSPIVSPAATYGYSDRSVSKKQSSIGFVKTTITGSRAPSDG